MRGLFLAAVAMVAALAVPSALAAPKATPCAHVSRSEVQSILGFSVTSTRDVPAPGVLGFTVCFFATSTNPSALSVGFQTQTGKTTYAADIAQTGHLAKTVPGLGDKAFYNSSYPGGSTSLNVLKGNVLVSFVTPAPLAKVKKLARKVIATL
jgi:hypothetical protein